MASLSLLCQRCTRPAVLAAQSLPCRSFSTTPAALAKLNKPKIRVPGKKAMEAKRRRKAALAAKEDEKREKLPLTEAIKVLRAVEVASPNCSYELFVKTTLGSGMAVPKGRVSLPREAKPPKEDKILVFAEGKKAEEARKAGAHIVGGTELIEGIASNRIRATTILCTPDLIKPITPRLGRILGPLGLFPSERRGTVTDDIAGYIKKLAGTSEWRADKAGNIRAPIGMLHFPTEDVVNNFQHFMTSVKRATGHIQEHGDGRRRTGGEVKRVIPIAKVMLSSKSGPGIRIADA
ncbi:ribosomal protein L1-like protein [Schizophyllum commune]